jgi:hypothetical protein
MKKKTFLSNAAIAVFVAWGGVLVVRLTDILQVVNFGNLI